MKKFLLRFVIIVILIGLSGVYWVYCQIFHVNTVHQEAQFIHIASGTEKDKLVRLLKENEVLRDENSFLRVAQWMKYESVKPGRYLLKTDLNNRTLVSLLRSGSQAPVDVTISAARKIEEIASQVSKIIEADSISIISAFSNVNWLAENQLDLNEAITMVIPNTYEMYWNTSGEEFVNRMVKEHESFWTRNDRLKKLENLSLTKPEVSTLASIVEKESIQLDERPAIAGVYLNRLDRDIPLQADPTVVFAVNDFSIRRVLNRHLEIDSPYNTYKYPGLPPGPICMPSISSIDAVLDAEQHDYLFFCAKPGYNGRHAFARTNAEHERNARIYRRWLSSEGIRG